MAIRTQIRSINVYCWKDGLRNTDNFYYRRPTLFADFSLDYLRICAENIYNNLPDFINLIEYWTDDSVIVM